MHSILNNHYRTLLDELNRNSGGPNVAYCNCRSKGECPLDGRCNSKNVLYQTRIFSMEHSIDGERVCIGISAGNWKQGLYSHRHSFSNSQLRNQTTLSRYFWALRIKGWPTRYGGKLTGSRQPRTASMVDVTCVSKKKLV